MKILVDGIIVDTEECEVLESKNLSGYWREKTKYKCECGDLEFTFIESNFSNVSDYIEGEDKPNDFYSWDELIKNEGWEYEIDELRAELEDKKAEFENADEDDKEDVKNKMEELEEKIKELQTELDEYDNLIPNDAEDFYSWDNIGIGASSFSDFNYMGTTIYKNGDNFFVEDETYEDDWKGGATAGEILSFLVWCYKKFMDEAILDLIIENREIFEAYDEDLFKCI